MSTQNTTTSPPLGFGTGGLDPRASLATGANLVRAALDAGISHIDTARLYAEGRAEAMVGAAIAGRRDEVFLVTKGGIEPARNRPSRRAMNKALSLGRRLPGLASSLPEPRYARPAFGRFDVAELRASLEISLRRLGTDHVDLYLLHEAGPEHLQSGEVLGALAEWQRAGLIGTYGLASTPSQTEAVLARWPNAFPVVQVASSLLEPNVHAFRRTGRQVIIHSWLGPVLGKVAQVLETRPNLRSSASHALGFNLAIDGALVDLLVSHALLTNPGGRVLFSTSRPERIARMAQRAGEPILDAGQLETLDKIIADVMVECV